MQNLSETISDLNTTFRQKSERDFLLIKDSIFVWLYRVIRILLSVIFLWSGVIKLVDSSSFSVIIETYGLLPDILILPTALLLSLTEIILGLGLIFDIRGSLASITVMLAAFMAILLYGIWLGFDIDCGCFGLDDPESKTIHSLSSALFKDLILLVGILYLYLYRHIQALKPLKLSTVVNQINRTWR